MSREIETLLADLVAIPSVNPMGLREPGEGIGEADVADYVERFCRRARIPCERQEALPGRPNVIARLEGEDPRAWVLEAHMDTMPGEGMDIEPFSPKIERGRLYGRGACDTKASLAAMLMAMKTAAQRGRLKRSVCLAAVADEEFRFTGVQTFIRSRPEAAMAVVGEPTGLDVVVAHKGVLRWEVETLGRAAHSSRPELGDNAIYHMAPVLEAMREYADAVAREPGHPLAGGKTASVGVIRGGQTVNTVPDRCRIQIDRRTLPDEDPEAAYRGAVEFLRGRAPDETTWRALPPFLVSPGLDVSPDAPVARAVLAAARRAGLQPQTLGVSYGTDASHLFQAGIPSVVFGPGDIRQAHSAVEFVELRQLAAAQAALEELLLGE